jgi:hypothetical protein
MTTPSSLRPLLALLVLSAGASASAQDAYNLTLRPATVSGFPGGTVTLSVILQNRPEAVTGFSFGARHDAARLAFQGHELGAAVTAALGPSQPNPDFFVVDGDPTGGPGVVVALILPVQDRAPRIPAGDENEVLRLRYGVAAGAEGQATVSIAGDIGDPAVGVFIDLDGASREPTAPGQNTTATVEIGTAPNPFIRGDVNQNGRLSLADGLIILNSLFTEGAPIDPVSEMTRQNCLVVFNADGSRASGPGDDPATEDEGDIQLTDGIFVFNFLFLDGPRLPAPFPTCGQPENPTSDRMTCRGFTCPAAQ